MKKVLVTVILAIALCFSVSADAASKKMNADSQNEIAEKSESKQKVVKSGNKSEMTNKVNVNTASAEELKTLQGVGNAMADKIIEHRKAGKIKDEKDLKQIKGLKDKFIEKNKDRLLY